MKRKSMDTIKLRQIKIQPPKGKKLTDDEVKERLQRAQGLMDVVSGIFNTPKVTVSKRENTKTSE